MVRTQTAAADRDMDLLDDEEVVFEREDVVLTNLRLMANWSGGRARDAVTVKDVDGVRKLEGGQESRLEAGLKALAIGATLAAIQVPIDTFLIDSASVPKAVNIVNTLLFVAWAVGIGTAGYLILTSLIRVKPHTSLLFVRFRGKDVRVSFAGRGSRDAEELRAAFERQKRSTPF